MATINNAEIPSIRLVDLTDPPGTTPASGYAFLFVEDTILKLKDDTGAVVVVGAGAGGGAAGDTTFTANSDDWLNWIDDLFAHATPPTNLQEAASWLAEGVNLLLDSTSAAAYIKYDPDQPSLWSPTPGNVKDALDQIAVRLDTLENL